MLDVPIERVDAPLAPEFERRWRGPARPVILRGALREWPASTRWSLAFLRDTLGTRALGTVAVDARGFAGYSARTGVRYQRMAVSEVVDALEAGRCAHYLVFGVEDEAPELHDDVRPLPYTAGARWRRSRFWLAPPDARGALHFDLPDNLYAQIDGRKEWVLFDPRDTLRVSPHPPWSGVPNYSRADAIEPDLERFPRMRGLRRWRAVLEPGELLYVPRRWWHQARSVDVSMAMNFWWAQGPTLAIVRAAEVVARVRGLRL